MRSWESLLRPHITDIKPYSSARDEFSGEAKVFLDANENPFDASNNTLNRYPDPHQVAIKQKLAGIKELKTNQIFIGNGSDEAIDLLFRVFCEPGKDEVITCPPTYGMYAVSAAINNIKNTAVALTGDYQLDTKAIMEVANRHTKMLFICNPNNPTGNSLRADDVTFLLQNFDGMLIIDEAYIDFSAQKSWITALSHYPKLVVMQTMSKAWGLAAVRTGMAFADSGLIRVLNTSETALQYKRAKSGTCSESTGTSGKEGAAGQGDYCSTRLASSGTHFYKRSEAYLSIRCQLFISSDERCAA